MHFTRSISTDLFFSKEREKQYNKHLQRIDEIYQQKQDHKKIAKECKKITQTLHKARKQARQFKSKEDKFHQGSQDIRMIRNMKSLKSQLKLNEEKPEITKKNKENPLIQYYRKCEDKKLADTLNTKLSIDAKKYKQKLTTEIGDYIKLRQHLQRFKTKKPVFNRSPKAMKDQRKLDSPTHKNYQTTEVDQTASRDTIAKTINTIEFV